MFVRTDKQAEKHNNNLRFIDESYLLDRQLFLTARLCEAAADREIIDEQIIQGVGLQIRHYIERRELIEHFFFKRGLEFHMSEIEQRAALLRLQLLYGRQK